jgi:uncharacterized protein YjdB
MKASVMRIIKKTACMSAVMTLLLCSAGLAVLADVAVTGVSLDKDTLNITVGKQETLIATVAPENAPNKNVTWTSSNPAIASVDSAGTITAVSVGSAIITVMTEDGNLTATCTVNVTPKLASIASINTTTFDLYVGETTRLTADLEPDSATNVVWSSDNQNVARVGSEVDSAVVTAVAPGTANITVASDDGNIKAQSAVTVKRRVSGISLDQTSLEMCAGDTITLTALISPEDATDKTVIWSSSNDEIASVADGIVTILSAGTAEITATAQDGSLKATCTITIKPDKISSPKYMVGNGLLTGVAKYTVLPIFKANLYNTGGDVRLYKPDGSELTGGIIGTGTTVKLSVGGRERDVLTVVVSGDADGDGGITVADYTLARLDILGLKPLAGNFRYGADVDGDGAITIKDYTLMRLDILNMKPISTTPPDLPMVADARIQRFLEVALSLQGKPYVWSEEGPDSFDCSGYVYYCLNQAGYSVGRSTANTYSINEKWQYVDRNALQPGDLMFYWSDSKPNYIGHVGIYLGNGYHIHASSDYGYVVICRVEGWYNRMLSHGRRVFN